MTTRLSAYAYAYMTIGSIMGDYARGIESPIDADKMARFVKKD